MSSLSLRRLLYTLQWYWFAWALAVKCSSTFLYSLYTFLRKQVLILFMRNQNGSCAKTANTKHMLSSIQLLQALPEMKIRLSDQLFCHCYCCLSDAVFATRVSEGTGIWHWRGVLAWGSLEGFWPCTFISRALWDGSHNLPVIPDAALSKLKWPNEYFRQFNFWKLWQFWTIRNRNANINGEKNPHVIWIFSEQKDCSAWFQNILIPA